MYCGACRTPEPESFLDGKNGGGLLRTQYFSVNDSFAAQAGGAVRYGDTSIMLLSAYRNGNDLQLSPREFKLLTFLVRKREKALSRAQIAQSVWDIHFSSNTNVVDVYINYLRRKLDKDYAHPLIHTIKGRGYMLKQKEHEPAS